VWPPGPIFPATLDGVVCAQEANMRRNICILETGATADDAMRRACTNRSHFHARSGEVIEGIRAGKFAWVIPGEVAKLTRTYSVRGLSARVGAPLAEQVRSGQPWALVALEQVLRPHAQSK